MVDKRSNDIWKSWQNFSGFENRSFRFSKDMLPLFYKWLGITPDSVVLDAGCGTGVFARYLASGMINGHVDGFDINQRFIEYGNEKLKELDLCDKVTLTLADGFALPLKDNVYDAVTNYTYISVLSDPVAGLKELIRVCKPGGVVSCVVATNSIPRVVWQGDYPFDGADELQRLAHEEMTIFSKYATKPTDFNQSEEWHVLRYPKMFEVCGLKHVSLYPFAYAFNFSDEKYSFEHRQRLLLTEIRDDIDWITARYNEKRDIYLANGFCDQKFNRLIELMNVKLDYVSNNFKNDKSFEWMGGFNFIVTGVK